jgi:catechol 2,3-dioxygenase-like lactoylglutathione lyase family enzyme
MEQRLSFVTLGVRDVARSRLFYCDGLGWRQSRAGDANVAFIDAGGVVLALFGRSALAADAGIADDGSGFSGLALAHNVREKHEVDRVLATAAAAGARLVKPAQDAFWGGYSGYFADPDGFLWEVAWNPFFPLDAAGKVTLPPPAEASGG